MQIRLLVLSFLLFSLAAQAAEKGTLPCRSLSAKQARQLIALFSETENTATCSNYDDYTNSPDLTRACRPDSYFAGAQNEVYGPCFSLDAKTGKYMPVWFATDTPDLNYYWIQRKDQSFFTSLGYLLGCRDSRNPQIERYLKHAENSSVQLVKASPRPQELKKALPKLASEEALKEAICGF